MNNSDVNVFLLLNVITFLPKIAEKRGKKFIKESKNQNFFFTEDGSTIISVLGKTNHGLQTCE